MQLLVAVIPSGPSQAVHLTVDLRCLLVVHVHRLESLVMKVPCRSQPRRSLSFTDVLFSRDAGWFFVSLLDMELKISNTDSQIFRDKRLARISGLTQI